MIVNASTLNENVITVGLQIPCEGLGRLCFTGLDSCPLIGLSFAPLQAKTDRHNRVLESTGMRKYKSGLESNK